MQFCDSNMKAMDKNTEVCVMYMDTDREKEIGLGVDYPYSS